MHHSTRIINTLTNTHLLIQLINRALTSDYYYIARDSAVIENINISY